MCYRSAHIIHTDKNYGNNDTYKKPVSLTFGLGSVRQKSSEYCEKRRYCLSKASCAVAAVRVSYIFGNARHTADEFSLLRFFCSSKRNEEYRAMALNSPSQVKLYVPQEPNIAPQYIIVPCPLFVTSLSITVKP